MKRWLLPLLIVSGCGGIPRDPDGTLDRIRHDHVIRVGRVAGAGTDDVADARGIVRRLAVLTGARAAVTIAPLEPLLLRLEAGEVDLVVGARLDEKTPWLKRVTLGPALAVSDTSAGRTAAHVVTRNGENAWITLVQREVRAAGGTS